MLHISCNIGTRDLPDMCAQGSRAASMPNNPQACGSRTLVICMHVAVASFKHSNIPAPHMQKAKAVRTAMVLHHSDTQLL